MLGMSSLTVNALAGVTGPVRTLVLASPVAELGSLGRWVGKEVLKMSLACKKCAVQLGQTFSFGSVQ